MASDIEVEWDEEGQRICIRRHGPGGPYSVGTKGFAISAIFPPKGNRTIFNSNMAYLGASEQTDDIWQKCIDLTKNARKSSVKLIERIARAMCKADGNDPDGKCVRGALPNLNGLASKAMHAPSEAYLSSAWILYAHAAEAAILELEAAAIDCLNADAWWPNGNVPVERTAWMPPQDLKKAWATEVHHVRRYGSAAELNAILNSEDGEQVTITPDGKVLPSRIHDEDIPGIGIEEKDKLAADFFNASKDAPLIEAIRREREKGGF